MAGKDPLTSRSTVDGVDVGEGVWIGKFEIPHMVPESCLFVDANSVLSEEKVNERT